MDVTIIITAIGVKVIGWLLSGHFKGAQDKAMKSGIGFDWKAKYKKNYSDELIKIEDAKISKLYYKYHKLFNLKYLEIKFLHATLLVSLTDKWHKYGTFRMLSMNLSDSIMLSITFKIWWLCFFLFPLFWIARQLTFHLKYSKRKRKVY